MRWKVYRLPMEYSEAIPRPVDLVSPPPRRDQRQYVYVFIDVLLVSMPDITPPLLRCEVFFPISGYLLTMKSIGIICIVALM